MTQTLGSRILGLTVPEQRVDEWQAQSTGKAYPFDGWLQPLESPTILIHEPDILDSLMAYLRDFLAASTVASQPLSEFWRVVSDDLSRNLPNQDQSHQPSVCFYLNRIFNFCCSVLKEFDVATCAVTGERALCVQMDVAVHRIDDNPIRRGQALLAAAAVTVPVLQEYQGGLEEFLPAPGKRVDWTTKDDVRAGDGKSTIYNLSVWTTMMGVPISFLSDGQQFYVFRHLRLPNRPTERIFSRSPSASLAALDHGIIQIVLASLLYASRDPTLPDPLPASAAVSEAVSRLPLPVPPPPENPMQPVVETTTRRVTRSSLQRLNPKEVFVFVKVPGFVQCGPLRLTPGLGSVPSVPRQSQAILELTELRDAGYTSPHFHYVRGLFEGCPVMVTVAMKGKENRLEKEARFYQQLEPLCGDAIPSYYGFYSGEWSMLVLGDAGHCINTDNGYGNFKTVSPQIKSRLYDALKKIHQLGVQYDHLYEHYVAVGHDGKARFNNFRHAFMHDCPGEECGELSQARRLWLQG